MELSDMSFGGSRVPWNSMECSMEFHGTKWYVIWRHQSSMEFHGMFHGIPWNKLICHLAAPEFHGIPWNVPWNSMELSDVSFGGTKVPWNSMECSMEFHGTKWYVIWRHQSSMEFHGIFHGIPWNTCVICNGALLIPWNPLELSDFLFGHSIEFHGIPCYIP